ncbi:SDR family NAD(P)-dependent oxidoreductase [Solitalea lacus]|uniref:SDR family NAD(P)-dependent oxidoreductase n=1 Tax=Solitalea lacus TaxID=2911172 RepID=UPI001EDA4FC7|nr:SDR family oxidoreductase [Solitalea lacus]UKJ08453.1 SDR family oxidoreductase [Solitalea lacus]
MNKRTALITGATQGIGYYFSRIMARNKVDLVLIDKSEDYLLDLALDLYQRYNVRVKFIPFDLGKPNAPLVVYNDIIKDGFQVDYLINSAGVGDLGFFHETDWEKEREMINLNVVSLVQLTKLFVNDMVKRGKGRVLNVASTAAFQPGPNMAVYYATKAFVLSFSEAIANELRDSGITVTALCPDPQQSGLQHLAEQEVYKLLRSKKLPKDWEVAEFGFHSMIKGKTVAVNGFMNQLLVNTMRLFRRDTRKEYLKDTSSNVTV